MATIATQPGLDNNSNQGQGTNTNLNAPQTNQPQTGNSQQTIGVGSAPSTGGGSGGASKGTAAGPAPSFQNNFKPTSSGSFTNLQNYLNANQGWEQNGGLGGQIVNNINNQANTTANNLNNAQNVFTNQQSQAQNQYSPYTSDIGQGTTSNAYTTASGIANNAVNNTPGTNDNSTIKTLTNANYTGPSGLESVTGSNNLTNLQNQVGNISSQANQATTEGGRYNLLGNLYGSNKAGYNTGQQTLDNALIQQSPQQLATLSGATRASNALANNLNSTETQDQAAAQQAALTDQQIAAASRQALNNATNSYLQALPGNASNPTTVPLSDYKMGANNITANPYNTMTADQFTALNNLNSLLGGTNGTVGNLANTSVGAALAPYLVASNQAQAGQYQRDTSGGLGKTLGNMGQLPVTTIPAATTQPVAIPTQQSGASGGFQTVGTQAPMTFPGIQRMLGTT